VVVYDLGVPRSATFVSWLEHKCFLNVQKRLFKRFKIFPNSIIRTLLGVAGIAITAEVPCQVVIIN